MSDELVPTGKLSSIKRTGFAARVQQAREESKIAADLFDCTKYANRIILCIDDSGSMSSVMKDNYLGKETSDKSRMQVCRQACQEFVNVCDSRDTALGMYTISTGQEYTLTVAYQHILSKILALEHTGGTPTIETLDKIISKEKCNRVVLVSDGESGAVEYMYNDSKQLNQNARIVLNKYKEAKAVIDTVYIGTEGDNGETEMRLIAEYTGGMFMFFKEGESFRTKLKYLAPVFRAMLTSGEIKL